MKKTPPATLLEEQPTTVEVADTANVPMVPETGSAMQMFERLASNPNASVETVERLMALWERSEAKRAELAFNAAMAAAQKEMEPIAADQTNNQTHSRYASYAALDRVLRPIYTKHGFALSFNTGDATKAEDVRVICDVSHIGGHSKPYKVDMPADGKGAKGGDVMTKTHATGSAMAYGMRYLLKFIFNVAVGEQDDDGNKAGDDREQPEAPAGYARWIEHLQDVAMSGLRTLTDAFNKGTEEHRRYLTRFEADRWRALKRGAEQVGR